MFFGNHWWSKQFTVTFKKCKVQWQPYLAVYDIDLDGRPIGQKLTKQRKITVNCSIKLCIFIGNFTLEQTFLYINCSLCLAVYLEVRLNLNRIFMYLVWLLSSTFYIFFVAPLLSIQVRNNLIISQKNDTAILRRGWRQTSQLLKTETDRWKH